MRKSFLIMMGLALAVALGASCSFEKRGAPTEVTPPSQATVPAPMGGEPSMEAPPAEEMGAQPTAPAMAPTVPPPPEAAAEGVPPGGTAPEGSTQ